jgi:hypothetical protein
MKERNLIKRMRSNDIEEKRGLISDWKHYTKLERKTLTYKFGFGFYLTNLINFIKLSWPFRNHSSWYFANFISERRGKYSFAIYMVVFSTILGIYSIITFIIFSKIPLYYGRPLALFHMASLIIILLLKPYIPLRKYMIGA